MNVRVCGSVWDGALVVGGERSYFGSRLSAAPSALRRNGRTRVVFVLFVFCVVCYNPMYCHVLCVVL